MDLKRIGYGMAETHLTHIWGNMLSSTSVARLARPRTVWTRLASAPSRRWKRLARSSVRSLMCASNSNLPVGFPYPVHYSLPNPPQPTILACSSSAASSKTVLGALQKVASRIQDFLDWLWEAWVVSVRGMEIGIRLSPLLILSPAAVASRQFNDTVLSDWAWAYTYHAVQALGPAFIKLAQWAATRRDLFPHFLCDRLAELHDRGSTHTWKHTHRTLQQAFGDDYTEKGLQIEEHDNNDNSTIVGSGSAAQVYKGTLVRSNGVKEQVAIKVLHPNFASMVERDLTFIQAVANLLHALPLEHIRMINLPRVAQNFGFILRSSADLRVEGLNLEQFDKNFADQPLVCFPRPVEGWVDRRVLVEEYVGDSKPISEFLQDTSPEGWKRRKKLAGPLLRAFLKMVFLDNFVHGDLHPGNVLVVENKKIVFLDAGISTSLSPNDQRNLIDLFRAVLLNDGRTAGRLMVERAKFERCSQVEGGVEAFAQGIDEIVAEFHDRRKKGLTLGAVKIGSLLSRVLDLCRVHGVEIDPSMASIVLSTLVLEGLGRSLQPDLNLIDFALPFVMGKV